MYLYGHYKSIKNTITTMPFKAILDEDEQEQQRSELSGIKEHLMYLSRPGNVQPIEDGVIRSLKVTKFDVNGIRALDELRKKYRDGYTNHFAAEQLKEIVFELQNQQSSYVKRDICPCCKRPIN